MSAIKGQFGYLNEMVVNMNGKNHCRTWWRIIAYTKLVFLILLHETVFENFRLFFIQIIFMYKVEMSTTQREWTTSTAAPLQRSYGVVALSQKYQNF